MAFWDKVYRAAKKALEKGLWRYTAYEIGNSDNDSEKIRIALIAYQQQTNSKQHTDTSETLAVIVFSSIILTILLLIVFCFKVFTKRAVREDRQIRLNTLNSTNSNNNNGTSG